MSGQLLLGGAAQGPVLASTQGLSFWGGVDPATARVIDAHHSWHGQDLAGKVVMMPTSRGSCTGSGILLDLALSGKAPAALVFCEAEDVLTLGAIVAAQMFQRPIPVVRLSRDDFLRLADCPWARISEQAVTAPGLHLPLSSELPGRLTLSAAEQAMLDGAEGPGVALAMRILTAMARHQGAARLLPISRAHVDGCILASRANLTFAEALAETGVRVRVPTSTNAISVEYLHWRAQGVDADFGRLAQRLADAYLRMGCQPSFTCAPYLLDSPPAKDEAIAWAESNAVIYANSILGARTPKHPDFLDICMAVTGRAPLAGVYLDTARQAQRLIRFRPPARIDDSFWPVAGYLAGLASPDRIPLLQGLAELAPGKDALKALCAAFGTTSAAPMLHIEGITAEADRIAPHADSLEIGPTQLRDGWQALNRGPADVDLIAIGSPHASAAECRLLAANLSGKPLRVPVVVTLGRSTAEELAGDGTLALLREQGVRVVTDLCWCSITEPVLPPQARHILTNSGKYAHYGPGLSGRSLRLASLVDCARAAHGGRAPDNPAWSD